MAKVIVFNVPASGHVNPSLPVVAELVRRGENVIYYLTEGYRAKVEATGATFRAYDQLDDDYFGALDGSNPFMTVRQLAETSLDILPDLVALLRAEQPDYIIFDAMCPWGRLAGEICGVPTVSSLALLLLTPGMMVRSGQLLPTVALMLRNLHHLRAFNRVAAEIARTHHLPQKPGFANMLMGIGTLNISYTSAAFQPESAKLAQTIRFVGPSIEPRAGDADFPFDQLAAGEPLIYISLGTVINQNVDFYRQCLVAFGGEPYQVVMAVGQKTDLEALGAIPANFIVRRHVPQLEVLQRAALFITHAGINSVHEGLYYNVPLLLVPQQQEQAMVAARVVELGAGEKLGKAQASAANLRAAAARILNDNRCRERAAAIGETFRSAGGYRRAADEILKLSQ